MAGSAVMDRKIISVTGKRQITIPLKFFEKLGMGKEIECELSNDAIVLRPFKTDSGFATDILKDLVSQGYDGNRLIEEFELRQKNIVKAVGIIVNEADEIASGKKKGASMDDVFGED